MSVRTRFIGFVSYYGHASNTSNLGSDMHLSFVFAALVEIPAFSIPFVINYGGRKWTLFICFLASGAMSIFYVSTPSGIHHHSSCIAFHFKINFYPLPLDLTHVALTLALLGRMFATGAYYVCLQYSSEIIPTSIRGSGMSACEIIGGIGLLISPWIIYLVSTKMVVCVFLHVYCFKLETFPTGQVAGSTATPNLWRYQHSRSSSDTVPSGNLQRELAQQDRGCQCVWERPAVWILHHMHNFEIVN